MDAYLIVDPDARTIEVPEVEKVFGVYGDNNAERKYFKCPRIVGNKVDLSKCYIYVNYISAATKVGQIMCDIGDVDGVDTNGDEIVFSWPITRNVLDKNESTNLFFAVQAKTTTGDTVFTTRKAEGFCYESIEGTETVAEEYADIVLQLISRMDNVEANIGEQVAAYFKENPAVTAEYLDQTLQPVKNDVSQLKKDLGDVAIKDSDRLNLYDGISYRQGYYDGSKWTTFGKSLIIASGLVKYNDRLTFSEDALIGSTYYTMCIDDEDNILARPQNNKNTIAFTNEKLKEKSFSVYVRVPEDYDISKFIAVIGSTIPDTWTLGEKVNFSLKDGSVTHNTIANNTIKAKNIEPKSITANCTSFLYENSIINNIYDGTTYKNGHWDGSKWVDWGTTKSLKINLGLVQFRDNLCVSADSAVNGTYSISMFDREDTFIHQTSNTNNVLSMTNVKLQNKTFYCYVRVPIDYDISSFIAVIGDKMPTGYSLNDVTKVQEPSLPKYLQRKLLVIDCFGDSFTAPSTAWHDYLRKKTGWKILNHGVSSSRISIDKKVTGELDTDGNEVNKTVLSFLNRVSDIDASADVVIIFGGINDAYSINDGSITIGTIDSELDTTTFYGALKKLIVDIKNKMPSKKIIGVIPPDFMPTESYINTLPLVQDACRKVYRFYGIPFADLKYNCQEMYESDYNNSVYRLVSSSVDNYHPSDLGHEAIAKIIYKTVSGIIDF